MVLTFDEDGMLPRGDYPMTIEALKSSILVVGPGEERCPNWDTKWRLHLVENLEVMAGMLWQAGIENIFIDGSFAEDKDHPKDIDGYFETTKQDVAFGSLAKRLDALEQGLWNWDPNSRRKSKESSKAQLPMWHKYRVELYPHYKGMKCGIKDKFGNEMEFPAAFRKSRRDDRPRGIVRLERP